MLHSNVDVDVSGVWVLLKVACVQARIVRDPSLESSPPAIGAPRVEICQESRHPEFHRDRAANACAKNARELMKSSN